jgi:hypothetical protein
MTSNAVEEQRLEKQASTKVNPCETLGVRTFPAVPPNLLIPSPNDYVACLAYLLLSSIVYARLRWYLDRFVVHHW